MKVRYTLLFVLLFASLSAFAGPQIGVLDPTCNQSSGFTNIFNIGDPLNITPNANGGGVFTFCNLTGQTWSSARFTAQDVFGFTAQTWIYGYPFNTKHDVTCSPGTAADRPFTACVVQIDPNDKTAGNAGSIFMTFFNISNPPDGVESGHSMTVTLNTGFCLSNCGSNSGDWTKNGVPVPLVGSVVHAPEPAGLMLLASGIMGLGLMRRKIH
jgi:hypothetical protein